MNAPPIPMDTRGDRPEVSFYDMVVRCDSHIASAEQLVGRIDPHVSRGFHGTATDALADLARMEPHQVAYDPALGAVNGLTTLTVEPAIVRIVTIMGYASARDVERNIARILAGTQPETPFGVAEHDFMAFFSDEMARHYHHTATFDNGVRIWQRRDPDDRHDTTDTPPFTPLELLPV